MEITELTVAAIMATSTMTLFSYMISKSFRKLYKEPVLLQYLMAAFDFELSKRQKVFASWVLHYFIGLLFVLCFYLPIWLDCAWYKIAIIPSVIFGCIIGCIGIAGWNIMFKLAPSNPPVNPIGYYLQLFLAHIVFAVTIVPVHLLFT
jgi:hypothetical protein